MQSDYSGVNWLLYCFIALLRLYVPVGVACADPEGDRGSGLTPTEKS